MSASMAVQTSTDAAITLRRNETRYSNHEDLAETLAWNEHLVTAGGDTKWDRHGVGHINIPHLANEGSLK